MPGKDDHVHTNCVHVTPASEMPKIIIVDDRRNDLIGFAVAIAASGLSTVHAHADQLAAPPIPYEKPKTFKARRRGPAKGMLAMMVDLGATPPPAPVPPQVSDADDPARDTRFCIPCRLDLFGNSIGQMTSARCEMCHRFICDNCDAEHDGVDWHPNHTGDARCRYYDPEVSA